MSEIIKNLLTGSIVIVPIIILVLLFFINSNLGAIVTICVGVILITYMIGDTIRTLKGE